MPISTIVLEGIPRDLKSVFRKWRDENSPTIMHVSGGSGGGSAGGARAAGANGGGSGAGAGAGAGGQKSSPLKRARSLRVIPLTHALQAFAE